MASETAARNSHAASDLPQQKATQCLLVTNPNTVVCLPPTRHGGLGTGPGDTRYNPAL